MLLADLLICHPRWILSTFWSEAGLFTLSYSFDDKSFISYTLSVLKAVDYVLTSSLNNNLIQSHQKLRSDVFNTATCYIVFIVCNQNLTHFIYIRSSQFQGLSPSPNSFSIAPKNTSAPKTCRHKTCLPVVLYGELCHFMKGRGQLSRLISDK